MDLEHSFDELMAAGTVSALDSMCGESDTSNLGTFYETHADSAR